jgi:adenine-specific DNA-methyltransferase
VIPNASKTTELELGTIADLTPDERNANKGTQRGLAMLEDSLRRHGAGRSILVDKHGTVIAGNKTLESAASIGLEDVVIVKTDGTKIVAVQRTDIDLDTPEGRRLAVADNRTSEVGLDWDIDALNELLSEGLDTDGLFSAEELSDLLAVEPEPKDAPDAQLDRAEELRAQWGTERGQVWRVGPHRLMCGDSTDAGDVATLMDGAKAALVLADPPYYEKVDADWDQCFDGYEQFLHWLRSVFELWSGQILDRGTAGWWCAPDYAWHIEGILRDYFAVFNHVVWSKGATLGKQMSVDAMRRWLPRSERLILCEKQHSPDALLASFNAKTAHIAARTAYASVIERMKAWREQAGLSTKEIDAYLGTNGMAGHYFGSSQWSLPTREVWSKLRGLFAARGVDIGEFDAQRQEFDAQRREFDAQRREFDAQAGANLTDVWDMPAPQGDERPDHPTPKPVPLIAKLVSAHSRPADVIADPFLGSGTTMVAAEQLGRVCYGMEIEPRYVAVSLQRMADMGLTPERA